MLPIEKLRSLNDEFQQLKVLIADPANMADAKAYRTMARRYKELNAIMDCWHKYQQHETHLEETRSMLVSESDEDMLAMTKDEIANLEIAGSLRKLFR